MGLRAPRPFEARLPGAAANPGLGAAPGAPIPTHQHCQRFAMGHQWTAGLPAPAWGLKVIMITKIIIITTTTKNRSGDGELCHAVTPGAWSPPHMGAHSRAQTPKRRWKQRGRGCVHHTLRSLHLIGERWDGSARAAGEKLSEIATLPPVKRPTLGTDLIPGMTLTSGTKQAGWGPLPPSPAPSAAGSSVQRCEPPLLKAT